MIRKIIFLLTFVSMSLLAAAPAAAVAADGIEITQSTYSGLFPTTLTFNVSAASSANIIDARLHYRVDRQSFTDVENEVFVPVAPAKEINLSYTLDLRRTGGLPPGTGIEYWWTVEDAAGGEAKGAVNTLTFDDTRYQWQNLKQGLVTLYWYSGPGAFAQELMDTAQQALSDLEKDTGARLTEPVSLYIYDSAQSLQGSMVFPQEWTGGVAFTDFNTIAIGIEPANITWGKRAIVHELAHLVTGQMTDNPYNGIPTWLNEGLSMYAEGPPDTIYSAIFNLALQQKSLISVRSLSSPFSADANISYLSYAESYFIVKYLIDKYGQNKMLQLLDTFSRGATNESALMAVYGFDIEGLNKEWQAQAYASGAVRGVVFGTIDITRSTYSIQFPSNISFNLAASGADDIVDARLHYRVDRRGFSTVENEVFVKLSPAKEIEASYSLNLRRAGGLPPGTKIDYWWTLTDTMGRVTQSQISTLAFEDTRYQWQALEQGMVTLYWYSGSESFARELMNTAQLALARLEKDTGARLSEPAAIYIYDGAQALQGSMIFAQEWTGGVAFPDFDTIAIGIEPGSLRWGKRAVIHELAHLVTGQMTANPYGGIPTWLNEGLSMYAEGPLDAIYVAFYNEALDEKTLISVRSLASPFSADPNTAYLSYAESYHMVKYLIDKYGQEKMSQLLGAFNRGETADGALMAVYGLDMESFNLEWQQYAHTAPPERVSSDIIWTPWLAMLIVMVSGVSAAAVAWLFYPVATANPSVKVR